MLVLDYKLKGIRDQNKDF